MKRAKFVKSFIFLDFALFVSILVFAYHVGVRINLTTSLPERFWLISEITNETPLSLGDYVVVSAAMVNSSDFDEDARLSYFGNAPFLKKISGVPGDIIRADMDGAKILSEDSVGRRLPKISFPVVLDKDEFWLTSDMERGFDSRYFGAVKRVAITAKARPLF